MTKLLWFLRLVIYLLVSSVIANYLNTQVINALAEPWLAYLAIGVFLTSALIAGLPYFRLRGPDRYALRLHRESITPSEAATCKSKTPRDRWRLKWVRLPGKRVSIIRTTALLIAALSIAGTACLNPVKEYFIDPYRTALASVENYDPAVTTRVYSIDDELICSFGLQNRQLVSLEEIPQHVSRAFTAAEDRNFFQHHGFDPRAIVRAALANFQSGDIRQGGSTITQQVVRGLILRTNERTFERKFREIFLAVELERLLPKDRILEIYLNEVFLGRGSYGIEAAARTYFGKSVGQLSLAEAAMLAGLPKAPSSDSPYWHYERARARMRYVLRRMIEDGIISTVAAEQARDEDMTIIWAQNELNRSSAPYFCDLIRRELKNMFGNQSIFEDGLIVRTTLDMRMQRAAESAVRRGLLDLERRVGWQGPEAHQPNWPGCTGPVTDLPDGLIDTTATVVSSTGDQLTICVQGNIFPLQAEDVRRVRRWEARSHRQVVPGDIISTVLQTDSDGTADGNRYASIASRTGGATNPTALQAALVSVDPANGHLLVLVGGYDFTENQFNNATMARRQVGSSIKPYVYLTALMHGMRVDDIVTDQPVCYIGSNGRRWCPTNYVGPTTRDPYMGRVSLRTALAKSLNSVSVQLAHRVGIEEVIRVMRSLGISSNLDRYLPLAVGAAELTPWEHTYAYASIAAGGRVMPRREGSTLPGIFILSVSDAQGRELFRQEEIPQADWPQAVPAADAYALIWLMRGVVEEGTGRQVQQLQRPAGGKTGTTNNFRDAWFLGFTADLVTGIWVGRNRPIRISWEATGGTVALPIWLGYMQAAHPDTPARDFPVPADVMLTYNERWQLVPYQRGRLPNQPTAIALPADNDD
ncbi:PBP1A family penicillin-binding protein [Patescibacteria group bacterium]|nr:PBP1A family penicillin-binding protein [Patescibacteria group bacterium]MBU1028674.1 PBP1A family penicillin-binding protein [Patescibacteria group bacterium]MBU1915701.1 PBP1A family penicillin-binding protein [Patescibacteria group bacterium]